MWQAVLGEVAGGAMNYFAQQEANEANKKLAREQMGFQERMSNTSYQRARDDMIKAGINPLMASGGGASTPGGSTATVQAHRLGDSLSKGVSSAIDTRRLQKEISAVDSQTKLNDEAIVTQKTQQALNASSAKKVAADTIKSQRESDLMSQEIERNAIGKDAFKAKMEVEKGKAQFDKEAQGYDNWIKRIREGIGVVGDATSSIVPKIRLQSSGTDRVIDSKTGEILQESKRHYRRR